MRYAASPTNKEIAKTPKEVVNGFLLEFKEAFSGAKSSSSLKSHGVVRLITPFFSLLPVSTLPVDISDIDSLREIH